MKVRLLFALVLLPALAHADALSAYGMGQAFAAILALGVTLLVAPCFLIAMYSWPQWRGLPYLLGVPLLLLIWMYRAASDPDNFLLPLLLALLFNGLVWVRAFRPLPMRRAGAAAILIGSVGLVSTILGFHVLPLYHKSSYADSAYEEEPAPLPKPPVLTADDDRPYTYVEHMPDRAAIKALIEQQLVLPPKTARGHVYVQFVVSKKGVVSHPLIVKGEQAAVDSAVVAAVRRLPALTPGTQYGRLVNVSLVIPVDVGKRNSRE